MKQFTQTIEYVSYATPVEEDGAALLSALLAKPRRRLRPRKERPPETSISVCAECLSPTCPYPFRMAIPQ